MPALSAAVASEAAAETIKPPVGCTAANLIGESDWLSTLKDILTVPEFSLKEFAFGLTVILGSSAYATEHIDSAIAMASIIVITRFIVFLRVKLPSLFLH